MSADRPGRDPRPSLRYDDKRRPDSAPASRSNDRLPPPQRSLPSSSPLPSLQLTSSRDCSRGTPAWSGTPDISSTREGRSSSRVKSSTYRDDLRRNRIGIEPQEIDKCKSYRDYGQNIIKKARNSPQLPDDEVKQKMRILHGLRDEDEDTIKGGYISTHLLPGADQYPGMIKVGNNVPLDTTYLPRRPLAPPLSGPKPDQTYCIDRTAFTPEQDAKQATPSLRNAAKASAAGNWPFLTIEFKSEARGGTFWVAENQNAGNGAVCVNLVENAVAVCDTQHERIDSISFSCNINAKHADIWLHFCEEQDFMSTEIAHYHMGKANEIIEFRSSIRNIIDFGINDRLPKIQAVLAQTSLPRLADKDKVLRLRRGGSDSAGLVASKRVRSPQKIC